MTSRRIDAGGAVFSLDIKDALTKKLAEVQSRIDAAVKRVNAIGASVGGVGVGLAKAGSAVAAFGGTALAGFGSAVVAAGNFAETVSKFEAVFGDQADAVREWASTFGKQVGRSESDLLRFLGNAQDTFVPLGFDPKEAAEFSKQLTTLSVDLASFNNISDGEAFDRLLSAVVGNTENLRAFGVVAGDAQIKAEALAQGFDPKALTPYQKALSIVSLTMKGTTAAQGDATRTAGSFNNQVKSLRASVDNLVQSIGQPLIAPATRLVKLFGEAIDRIKGFVTANQELVKQVALVAVAVTGAGAAIAGIGAGLIGAGLAFTVIGTAIGGLVAALSTVATVGAAAFAAITSPIGLVVVGITAAVAAIVKFTGAARVVSDVFGNIGGRVSESLGRIREAFAEGGIAAAARQVSREVLRGWEILVAQMRVAWAKMADFVKAVGENVAQALINAFSLASESVVGVLRILAVNFEAIFLELNKQANKFLQNMAGVARTAAKFTGIIGKRFLEDFDKVVSSVDLTDYEGAIKKAAATASQATNGAATEIQQRATAFANTLSKAISATQGARKSELEKLQEQLLKLTSDPVRVEIELPDVGGKLKNAFSNAAKRFSAIFSPANAPKTNDVGTSDRSAQQLASSNASVAGEIAAFAPTFDGTNAIEEKQLSTQTTIADRLSQVVSAVQSLGADIGTITGEDAARAVGAGIADIAAAASNAIKSPETLLDSISGALGIGETSDEDTASEGTLQEAVGYLKRIAKGKRVMGQ